MLINIFFVNDVISIALFNPIEFNTNIKLNDIINTIHVINTTIFIIIINILKKNIIKLTKE